MPPDEHRANGRGTRAGAAGMAPVVRHQAGGNHRLRLCRHHPAEGRRRPARRGRTARLAAGDREQHRIRRPAGGVPARLLASPPRPDVGPQRPGRRGHMVRDGSAGQPGRAPCWPPGCWNRYWPWSRTAGTACSASSGPGWARTAAGTPPRKPRGCTATASAGRSVSSGSCWGRTSTRPRPARSSGSPCSTRGNWICRPQRAPAKRPGRLRRPGAVAPRPAQAPQER